MTPPIQVDVAPLLADLEQLARFSEAEPPAVTRILFSEQDLQARAFLKCRCAETGLAVRQDPAGNLFARWTGAEPALAAVGTGSHTDAIPFSGRYDGTVGVLGALHAIRALQAARWRGRRSIELLMFTSEEPTRFGIGCIGSRLLSGSLSPDAAAIVTDVTSGATFEAWRRQAGWTGALADVRLPPDYYAAFVELHIEQGPLLERAGIPIGVVTAIAAPAALRVRLDGEGGHAGAVLMADRKDALCAAAEIVLAVERAAKATGRTDTVATTGVCQVHPSAINSIPARVMLEIDIRDTDLGARDRIVESVKQAIRQSTQCRGLRAQIDVLNADPPASAGPEVVASIEAACRRLQLDSMLMVSRAYHDSLFMARICPTGMIFIPCKDGISHRPDEYASPQAIEDGVNVLALTLAELAGAPA
jgi:N-carbamoyl-L-amino-acid hydrolase